MKQIASFQEVNTAFVNGSFATKTDAELISYLAVLAREPSYNQNLQHLAIIRAQTINDLLMQRHIEKLDKQSAKTQRWFMVLAVASLFASLVDIFKG
jgi:hypothetical protein